MKVRSAFVAISIALSLVFANQAFGVDGSTSSHDHIPSESSASSSGNSENTQELPSSLENGEINGEAENTVHASKSEMGVNPKDSSGAVAAEESAKNENTTSSDGMASSFGDFDAEEPILKNLPLLPVQSAPSTKDNQNIKQCADGGIHTIGSGVGEMHLINGNFNGLEDKKWNGNIDWKDKNHVQKYGYDALGIAADGSIWYFERQPGNAVAGANTKLVIKHGDLTGVGSAGYREIESYTIFNPRSNITGGTVDLQGRYIFSGDAGKLKESDSQTNLKLYAFDPTTKKLVVLGRIPDASLSKSPVMDLFFDEQGNFYVFSASKEGSLHDGSGGQKTLFNIYRVSASDYEAAVDNGVVSTANSQNVFNLADLRTNIPQNTYLTKDLPIIKATQVLGLTMENFPDLSLHGATPGPNGVIYIAGFNEGVPYDGYVPYTSFIYALDLVAGKILNGGKPVFVTPRPEINPNDAYNRRWDDQQISDLDGCPMAISTIAVQKNIVSRVDASDQFEVSITAPDTTYYINKTESASTSGDLLGEQAQTHAMLSSGGQVYTLQEKMLAGSASRLSDYKKSWVCTDADGTNIEVSNQQENNEFFSATVKAPTTTGQMTCTVTNAPKSTSLTITKIDAVNNSPLSGAVFTLCEDTNENGVCDKAEDRLEEKTTDGQGQASWNSLKVNKKYVLIEVSAPRGYSKIAKSISVTTTSDPVNLSVTNDRQLGTVIWQKTQADPIGAQLTYLRGSEWKIVPLDEHGDSIESQAISIADCAASSEVECLGKDKDPAAGKFRVEELSWGSYRLIETKAPLGYIKTNEQKTFQVGAETATDMSNNPQIIDLGAISNEMRKGPTMPHSGGWGEQFFLISGISVLAGAAFCAVLLARRRRVVGIAMR